MQDTSRSIIGTKGCYGCGLCVAACKKNVLDLRLNNDGFYEPIAIDIASCINCGMCSTVCSFSKKVKTYSPQHAFAGWSNDSENRKLSSSGGVAYEVAHYALSKGYLLIGVRYNVEKKRAEHYITSSITELKESQGSKYLQSYTIDALKKINREYKYIFVGTPCQVASMRLFIEKHKLSENFFLIDFFCHGVPSYNLWAKYLREHSEYVGDIESISWRNKKRGWHNGYCITLKGKCIDYCSYRENDDFYAFFLGDACLGKACYDSCKFKYYNSCSDIRLGDFWGKEYANNEEGVCSVVVNTPKGYSMLLSSNVHLKEYTFEKVAEGQMRTSAKRPWYYACSKRVLKKDGCKLKSMALIMRHHKIIKSRIQRIISIICK